MIAEDGCGIDFHDGLLTGVEIKSNAVCIQASDVNRIKYYLHIGDVIFFHMTNMWLSNIIFEIDHGHMKDFDPDVIRGWDTQSKDLLEAHSAKSMNLIYTRIVPTMGAEVFCTHRGKVVAEICDRP